MVSEGGGVIHGTTSRCTATTSETTNRYVKRCLLVIVSRILTRPTPNSPPATVLDDIVTLTQKTSIGTIKHISGQIGVFPTE